MFPVKTIPVQVVRPAPVSQENRYTNGPPATEHVVGQFKSRSMIPAVLQPQLQQQSQQQRRQQLLQKPKSSSKGATSLEYQLQMQQLRQQSQQQLLQNPQSTSQGASYPGYQQQLLQHQQQSTSYGSPSSSAVSQSAQNVYNTGRQNAPRSAPYHVPAQQQRHSAAPGPVQKLLNQGTRKAPKSAPRKKTNVSTKKQNTRPANNGRVNQGICQEIEVIQHIQHVQPAIQMYHPPVQYIDYEPIDMAFQMAMQEPEEQFQQFQPMQTVQTVQPVQPEEPLEPGKLPDYIHWSNGYQCNVIRAKKPEMRILPY